MHEEPLRKDLMSLLKELEEPNRLINQAMEVRLQAFNNKSDNLLFTALLPEERDLEWKAYTNFFKLQKSEECYTPEEIFNAIKKPWDEVTFILQDKLNFNIVEFTDLNSYHNLCFDLDNFDELKKRGIITDNHTSKKFITIEDKIFLGDLLGRGLPHIKTEAVLEKKYQAASTIMFDEQTDENELQKVKTKDHFKYFNFLKYNYLMLSLVIQQINFKIQLRENKALKFADLKNIYLLGNHDCGQILFNDFGHIDQFFDYNYYEKLTDLYSDIDKINRFLIPSEVVFYSQQSEEIIVCSHSGGMTLLGDKTTIKEKKYSDFSLSEYRYSLSDSIQDKFNKLTEDDKYFIYHLLNTMKKMMVEKKVKKDNEDIEVEPYYSNPFLWCDFFTSIKENYQCFVEKNIPGRYQCSNIEETLLLFSLFNILKINYNIGGNKMIIFRGHEHEAHKLEKFKENNCYNVSINSEENVLLCCSLPPPSIDNQYLTMMPKNYDHNKNIIIEQCLECESFKCTIKEQIRKYEPSINLLKFFFKNNDIYDLSQSILGILKEIQPDELKEIQPDGLKEIQLEPLKENIVNLNDAFLDNNIFEILFKILSKKVNEINIDKISKENFENNPNYDAFHKQFLAFKVDKMKFALEELNKIVKYNYKVDDKNNIDFIKNYMEYIYQLLIKNIHSHEEMLQAIQNTRKNITTIISMCQKENNRLRLIVNILAIITILNLINFENISLLNLFLGLSILVGGAFLMKQLDDELLRESNAHLFLLSYLIPITVSILSMAMIEKFIIQNDKECFSFKAFLNNYNFILRLVRD